ncbi:hypothetical protein EDD94_5379 [Streptomyces sp. PanSC9]|nr:hypothetical protein EDD94_5379 [Streptomyces sp. PanSC9]
MACSLRRETYGCRACVGVPDVRRLAHADGVATGHRFRRPKPGGFYYGGCGTTRYAAVRFEVGAGAAGEDRVQLQDEGSGLRFFRLPPGAGWAFVGSDTYPATGDCSRFTPADLAHRLREWWDAPRRSATLAEGDQQ